MILTGVQIEHEVRAGRIIIDPFEPQWIEPNSYGFHLGCALRRYLPTVLDSKQPLASETIIIPDAGYVLQPCCLYLGETQERLGSDHWVPTLHSRRSTATLGFYIQVSAPQGHVGSKIPWTLEIVAIQPVIVYPGMLIGKVAFWSLEGAILYYQGKYAASTEGETSRLYEEFGGPR